MKIGFAQINCTVGDLRGNFEKILSAYERLSAAGADLVVPTLEEVDATRLLGLL